MVKLASSPRRRKQKKKSQPSPPRGELDLSLAAKRQHTITSNNDSCSDSEWSEESKTKIKSPPQPRVANARKMQPDCQILDDDSIMNSLGSSFRSGDSILSDVSSILSFDIEQAPSVQYADVKLPIDSDDDDDENSKKSSDMMPKKKRNPKLLPCKGKNIVSIDLLPAVFGSFSKKSTVATYKVSDGKLDCLREMESKPIAAVTTEALEFRKFLGSKQAESLEHIAHIRKNLDTPGLMDILTYCTDELQDIEDGLLNVNRVIRETKKLQGVVESARTMANNAASHWKGKDPRRYGKWMRYVIKADILLHDCDNEKRRQQEATQSAIKDARVLAAKQQAQKKVDECEVIDVEAESITPPLPNMPKSNNGQRSEHLMTVKEAPATFEARKEKEARNSITYKQFVFYKNDGQKNAKPIDVKAHRMKWEKGAIRCAICRNTSISHPRHMYRHITSPSHLAELRRINDKENATPLYQTAVANINPKAIGSMKTLQFLEYRSKALITAAKNNVSAAAIVGIAEDWVDEYSGSNVGCEKDLARVYAGPLRKSLVTQLCEILSGGGCYDEFGTTFDGTPSFAEAEAIIMRVVTKDWEIIEPLVKCGLYEKKVNSAELGSHVIDTIVNRCGKDLVDWMSTHQDRASTNKAAITDVGENHADANPTKNWCCTHTVSNAGKKALGDKGTASFAEQFQKNFAACVKTPGNARKKASEKFGEPVETAGGVRFFNKYEQLCQLNKYTPELVMKDIITRCIEKEWSPTSAANMMKNFNPDTDARASLGMAIVEIAAISPGLKTFAQGCYTLEGDACLILTALSVFERMEKNIDNGFNTAGLGEAVDRAVPMLEYVALEYSKKCDVANEAVKKFSEAVAALKGDLKTLVDEKKAITCSTSSRGRVSKKTTKTTNEDDLERITNDIVEKRIALRDTRKDEKEGKDMAEEARAKFNAWKEKFPHRTHGELTSHGKKILKPVGDYYKKLFNEDGGDCADIRKMAEAAEMFNPIFLATIRNETHILLELHTRAEKLKYFHFDRHFTSSFFKGLKDEMQGVVRAAKKDHDLDKIKPTRQYLTRLQRRIKRNKMSEAMVDWKHDAGEYAQRIWQWWKPRRKDFPFHAMALRLILLVQLSSCSVERVFSKLEKIRQVCGECLYDDMAEVRLFLQCNGDMTPLLASLKNIAD